MNNLITMSFAGSMIVLVYLILSSVVKNKSGFRWQMVCLKIALFFYLVPVEGIKFLLPRKLFNLLNVVWDSKKGMTEYKDIKPIYVPGGRYYLVTRFVFWISAIWFMIAFVYIAFELFKYFYIKRVLLKGSTLLEEGEAFDALQKFPELKNVYRRRNVRIYRNPNVKGPFTASVFWPLIILPKAEYSEGSMQDIYGHELYHIRNRDVLLKFLCIIVLGLHWYNPFSYLLFWQISKVSEHFCDECVIKNMDKKERIEYGMLLVYMSCQIDNSSHILSSKISGKKSHMKKRIQFIRDYKGKKATKLLIMLLVGSTFLVFLLSTMLLKATPTFLDPDDRFSDQLSFTGIDLTFRANAVINSEKEELFGGKTSEEIRQIPFGSSKIVFYDRNGKMYWDGDISESKDCIHRAEPGICYLHSVNSDHLCKVDVYRAIKCKECGIVLFGYAMGINYHECLHEKPKSERRLDKLF